MKELHPGSNIYRLLSTTALALCLTLSLPSGPGSDFPGNLALADDDGGGDDSDDGGDDSDDGGDDGDDGGDDGDDGEDGNDGGDDGDDGGNDGEAGADDGDESAGLENEGIDDDNAEELEPNAGEALAAGIENAFSNAFDGLVSLFAGDEDTTTALAEAGAEGAPANAEDDLAEENLRVEADGRDEAASEVDRDETSPEDNGDSGLQAFDTKAPEGALTESDDTADDSGDAIAEQALTGGTAAGVKIIVVQDDDIEATANKAGLSPDEATAKQVVATPAQKPEEVIAAGLGTTTAKTESPAEGAKAEEATVESSKPEPEEPESKAAETALPTPIERDDADVTPETVERPAEPEIASQEETVEPQTAAEVPDPQPSDAAKADPQAGDIAKPAHAAVEVPDETAGESEAAAAKPQNVKPGSDTTEAAAVEDDTKNSDDTEEAQAEGPADDKDAAKTAIAEARPEADNPDTVPSETASVGSQSQGGADASETLADNPAGAAHTSKSETAEVESEAEDPDSGASKSASVEVDAEERDGAGAAQEVTETVVQATADPATVEEMSTATDDTKGEAADLLTAEPEAPDEETPRETAVEVAEGPEIEGSLDAAAEEQSFAAKVQAAITRTIDRVMAYFSGPDEAR